MNLNERIEKTLYALHSNQCITLVSLPDDGLPEIYDELLQLKQSPQNYDARFSFIALNVGYLREFSVEAIEAEVNRELMQDQLPGEMIWQMIANGYELVILIDDLDRLVDPISHIEVCDAIVKRYRHRVKIVYLIEVPSFVEKFHHQLAHDTTLLENVSYLPIAQPAEHFGLKRLLEKSASEDEIERYAQRWWRSLPAVDVIEIKKWVTGAEVHPTKTVAAYQKVGLLDGREVAITHLRNALRDYRQSEGEVVVSKSLEHLTKMERKIVQLLQENDRIVTRDEVAAVIWADKAVEKYSDWAIDKRMSRLRKQLHAVGFGYDLQTIYGKGFKLVKIGR